MKSLHLIVFVKKNENTLRLVDDFVGWLDSLSNYKILAKLVHYKEKIETRGSILKKTYYEAETDFLGYIDLGMINKFEIIEQSLSLLQNNYDLVIGSRALAGSRGKRNLFRRMLSKYYNYFAIQLLNIKNCSDLQCHFKIFNRKRFIKIIPLVKNNHSFFDTELLFKSQKDNVRIKEIPILFNQPAEKISCIAGYTMENFCNTLLLKLKK
ncbi:hypothetical protein K9M16_05220 [Candidatus Babeliales bacterium]|nr:hypothetical protein [Candidatus Babeliales bacterium]